MFSSSTWKGRWSLVRTLRTEMQAGSSRPAGWGWRVCEVKYVAVWHKLRPYLWLMQAWPAHPLWRFLDRDENLGNVSTQSINKKIGRSEEPGRRITANQTSSFGFIINVLLRTILDDGCASFQQPNPEKRWNWNHLQSELSFFSRTIRQAFDLPLSSLSTLCYAGNHHFERKIDKSTEFRSKRIEVG